MCLATVLFLKSKTKPNNNFLNFYKYFVCFVDAKVAHVSAEGIAPFVELFAQKEMKLKWVAIPFCIQRKLVVYHCVTAVAHPDYRQI